jgi:hypothetical protein
MEHLNAPLRPAFDLYTRLLVALLGLKAAQATRLSTSTLWVIAELSPADRAALERFITASTAAAAPAPPKENEVAL